TIIVRFHPTSIGLVKDSINIDTNVALTNALKYALSGTGIAPDTNPKISVTVGAGGFGAYLSFGNVTIGKNSQKTFIIKNISDTIRKLTGTITAPLTSRFSIVSGGGPFSLDTGMSVTVTVQFKPDTAAQNLTDSIFVGSNATSPNNRIKVTIFGTGVKPTLFPRMTIGGIFGAGVNFRTDTIGKTPRTASITITNTSDSARTLTGTVASVNSPFSVLSGGGAFSLDSGKSITVQLQFQTTAVGIFYDTLRITANTDPTTPPAPVALVGTGYAITGAHISVQPIALNFGTNSQHNGSVSLTATIHNLADSTMDTLTGTISPPGSPFTATPGSGKFSLLQNDSMLIAVQFSTNIAGKFQDSIVITSNSNDNSKRLVIRLTGTVVSLGVNSGNASSLNSITTMPNPFKGKTTISFSLAEALPVSMKVFDILGKQVYASHENIYSAGVHQIEWNAAGVTDGTYVCVLSTGKETRSIHLILSKQ
ncbi:MAG: choice-of-anchor D domain-containing protein, partial [Candidatus Kapaibacterium sp.]